MRLLRLLGEKSVCCKIVDFHQKWWDDQTNDSSNNATIADPWACNDILKEWLLHPQVKEPNYRRTPKDGSGVTTTTIMIIVLAWCYILVLCNNIEWENSTKHNHHQQEEEADVNVSAMEGPIQTIVAIVRPDTEVSQDDSVTIITITYWKKSYIVV